MIVSLAAEPYETGHVLPHERTHPRIREERLRLLRATRVQPEPIFLLLDGQLEDELPDRDPISRRTARGSGASRTSSRARSASAAC